MLNNKVLSKNLFVVMLLCVGIVPAFTGGGQEVTEPSKGEEIIVKVGIVFPVTGPAAWVGEETINAWKMVFEKANNGELPDGMKIEYLIEDDRSNPTESVAAATKLITREKVNVILGPFNSHCAGPVTDYTEKQKIPTLLGGAAATYLQGRTQFTFDNVSLPAGSRYWIYVRRTSSSLNLRTSNMDNRFLEY